MFGQSYILFFLVLFIINFTNFRYKINQAINPDMHVDNIEFENVTNEYFNQYVSRFNDKKNNEQKINYDNISLQFKKDILY